MITQKEYVRLKSRLTRAQNSKDPERILAEATYGLRRFEEVGYPDQWARWERAAEDARFAIRHVGGL